MARNAAAPRTRADYEAHEAAWRKLAELVEVKTGRNDQPGRDAGGAARWPFSLPQIVGGTKGHSLRK